LPWASCCCIHATIKPSAPFGWRATSGIFSRREGTAYQRRLSPMTACSPRRFRALEEGVISLPDLSVENAGNEHKDCARCSRRRLWKKNGMGAVY
jgi:hypothetical protein